MDLIRFPDQPEKIEWPGVVVDLARGLVEGQGCVPAVCDALIEAGHHYLAEHFRRWTFHPRNCWAIRMILQAPDLP